MNRTYRYPPALRVPGLFGAILSGGILLGSLLAEIEAADVPDLILHGLGILVAAIILWLGLEFGMRRVALTPSGIVTRLLSERVFAWRDVRDVRNGFFGILVIAPKRGLPIVVWPFLEDFGTLIDALARHAPAGKSIAL